MKANETNVLPINYSMQFRGSNDDIEQNAPSFMNKNKNEPKTDKTKQNGNIKNEDIQ